jgi:serine/threonine protein kinase/tetratricopeptide (TPR) repeat protein
MNTDQDLLFGVLAVRAGLLDEPRLGQILAARGEHNGQPIADQLVARGWISGTERAALEAELALLLDAHDGNLASTLAEVADPSLLATLVDQGQRPAPVSAASTDDLPTIDAGAPDSMAERPTITAVPRPPAPEAVEVDEAPLSIAEELTVDHELGHVLVGALSLPSAEATTARYTLSHVHAKGGVGQVWLARDTAMGREVALKELRTERADSRAIWARFVEEARITGQLEHPGIVPVYELGTRPGDNHPYYTMRFIRGRTLGEAIRDYRDALEDGTAGPVEFGRLLNAFVMICDTVAYAHARGVIHRDLKSQNIVLGDYGEVMVLDWGLAKLKGQKREAEEAEAEAPAADVAATPGPVELSHDIERDETRQGQVMGTPAYMPPEQAAGRLDEIDERSDVYSLGAILYELLTGRLPFERCPLHEMLRRVQEESPKPPRQVDPNVPAALESVCLKALAKPPADRYPSATALGDEVRRYLADEPVAAYPEPWTKRSARWAKRHRAAVTAAAGMLAVTFLALGVGYVLVRRERDEAAAQREQARGAVNTMYTEVAEGWLEDNLDDQQKDFLERALAYYERFAGADAGTPAVLLERGRAQRRIGDIQRKLGRNAKAQEAYEGALATLDRLDRQVPGRAEVVAERGRVLTAHAALLVELAQPDAAERRVEPAVAALAALVQEHPDATEYALDLARAERTRGDLLRLRRRNADAAAAYRRAAATLEPIVAAAPQALAPRKELGRALQWLGRVLTEMDQTEPAVAALNQALDIQAPLLAEFPTIPRVREDLAITSDWLGLALRQAGKRAESETAQRRALAHYRRLADDFPRRPELRRELARGLVNLGVWLDDAGRSADAIAVYREAIPVLDELVKQVPDAPKPLRDLATVTNNLSKALMDLGRLDQAVAAYQRAVAAGAEVVRRFPDAPDLRDQLANTLINQGKLLADLEDYDGAEAAYEKAMTLATRLVDEHAEFTTYRATKARCLGHRAALLAQQQKKDEAHAAYGEAIALYEGVLKEPAGSSDYRADLALTLSNMTDLDNRPLAERERTGRRALELFAELLPARPDDIGLQLQVASATVNLGEVLEAQGNTAEAEKFYARAADSFEQLSRQPGIPVACQNYLAYALTDQGMLLLKTERPAEAREAFAKAAEAARTAWKGQNLQEYRKTLVKALDRLGEALLAEGHHAEVIPVALELTSLEPDRPEARLVAARLMARCMELAEADMSLPADQRAAEARRYGDRAVAQLRMAVDGGLPDPKQLDREPVFKPLLERADFQDLLTQPAPAARGAADRADVGS